MERRQALVFYNYFNHFPIQGLGAMCDPRLFTPCPGKEKKRASCCPMKKYHMNEVDSNRSTAVSANRQSRVGSKVMFQLLQCVGCCEGSYPRRANGFKY